MHISRLVCVLRSEMFSIPQCIPLFPLFPLMVDGFLSIFFFISADALFLLFFGLEFLGPSFLCSVDWARAWLLGIDRYP